MPDAEEAAKLMLETANIIAHMRIAVKQIRTYAEVTSGNVPPADALASAAQLKGNLDAHLERLDLTAGASAPKAGTYTVVQASDMALASLDTLSDVMLDLRQAVLNMKPTEQDDNYRKSVASLVRLADAEFDGSWDALEGTLSIEAY